MAEKENRTDIVAGKSQASTPETRPLQLMQVMLGTFKALNL